MRTALQHGIDDVTRAVQKLPVVLYLTWGDTRARYIRSVLGPLWLPLGTFIGVLGLGFLWTSLFGLDPREYIPSLTIGLVVWQMIAGSLSDAPGLFGRKASVIKNIALPLTFFTAESISRQALNFAHNLVVVVTVLVIYPTTTTPSLITLSVLGLLLTLLNLLWISTTLSIMGTRFRDLEPLVISAIPLLFFISPIIFRTEQAAMAEALIWSNPVTYAINAIREPLLGHLPATRIYLVMFATALVGGLLTMGLIGSYRKRIPYLI